MSAQANLPDGWEYDPYWRAAATVLCDLDARITATGGRSHGRIWAHVTPDGIDYPSILDEPWSGGERRLLRAAASMWNGQPVSLADLAAGLDNQHWQTLLRALAVLRDGLT